jgi:hypothetical protein
VVNLNLSALQGFRKSLFDKELQQSGAPALAPSSLGSRTCVNLSLSAFSFSLLASLAFSKLFLQDYEKKK